jgi:hypothetical protein
MAKLSEQDKKNLIADWKTGRYSQRDLVNKYGASKGTVGNLTKGIEQKNGHVVDAQITILTAKDILPPEEMGAIMLVAQEEIYNKFLITNATQLNLVRVTEHLSNNKKLEKIGIGDGIQHFEEVGLGASDYKAAQEAIDRASITLGISQRHANSQVNIQNTNAQQNNITVEWE